jgi:L-asparaginase
MGTGVLSSGWIFIQETKNANQNHPDPGHGGKRSRARPAAEVITSATKAGQIGVEQLLQALPELADWPLRHEQLAQLDSKDMDAPTWRRLALRVEQAMADDNVQGVVITHGTDTLEESAYLLHRLLHTPKPVVMTAAMRPASSCSPDGPQNLLEAMLLARSSEVHGVLVAMQGCGAPSRPRPQVCTATASTPSVPPTGDRWP